MEVASSQSPFTLRGIRRLAFRSSERTGCHRIVAVVARGCRAGGAAQFVKQRRFFIGPMEDASCQRFHGSSEFRESRCPAGGSIRARPGFILSVQLRNNHPIVIVVNIVTAVQVHDSSRRPRILYWAHGRCRLPVGSMEVPGDSHGSSRLPVTRD